MNVVRRQPLLSVEDYLAGERLSEVRHEYAAGQVFAMAAGSQRHNQLIFRLPQILGPSLAGCRGYVSDMKLRIDEVFCYPDAMVVCEPNNEAYFETPLAWSLKYSVIRPNP